MFALNLRRLLGVAASVNVNLDYDTPLALIGQGLRSTVIGSNAATIDVGDIEPLPPRVAAAAIIHELAEQIQLQTTLSGVANRNQAFATAHRTALGHEAGISEGVRDEANQFSSPPPHGGRWEWRVPYRHPGSPGVLGLHMILDGFRLRTASEVRHQDMDAFISAARSAGLVPGVQHEQRAEIPAAVRAALEPQGIFRALRR
ncbi:MAG TPA: hypothetical protein VJ890_05745 [Vineibacter sp.]|nr:hypothetical protein [Vineibacter sp.]